MAEHFDMAAQLVANSVRFGWYSGVNWALDRAALGKTTTPEGYQPKHPVPKRSQLFADLRAMILQDAARVRDGVYPPMFEASTFFEHLDRIRAMFSDLPETLERREKKETKSAQDLDHSGALPDYFVQDFHFQTGGYLSQDSAKLYDVQVETLFYGTAGLMRRAALQPLANEMRLKDQRCMTLLDVACGTGRFLREVRLAFPGLWLTGLDLSQSYLQEAKSHLGDLRPVTWLNANVEEISLPTASQDIVTAVFLFHELPPDVRRRATAEIARVLKPGGLFVFVDSLQMGDRPGWDGLLEAFPVRFHEPYFRSYAIDDLDAMFDAHGLARESDEVAFLSKVITRRKVGG
ncbi:MAG: class I SAM-dependent methyltransferase [Hyphomicrobiaceae bacterium]